MRHHFDLVPSTISYHNRRRIFPLTATITKITVTSIRKPVIVTLSSVSAVVMVDDIVGSAVLSVVVGIIGVVLVVEVTGVVVVIEVSLILLWPSRIIGKPTYRCSNNSLGSIYCGTHISSV